LTRFLVEQNEPHEFVQFVNHALDAGYDSAIKKHYAFDTIAELEQAWLRFERRINEPIREEPPLSNARRGKPFPDSVTLTR
jgi:hypothetical protein